MSTLSVPFYVVDAFTSRPFSGNPAGVALLNEWPSDSWLQSVAAEVALSETAFLVGRELRWFTPTVEVGLCGHATLATAHVLKHHTQAKDNPIVFDTRAGQLTVAAHGSHYLLDFPARTAKPDDSCRAAIEAALKTRVNDILASHDRYICFLDSAEQIAALAPDFSAIAALPLAGLVVTAPGKDSIDFVSRYFAPAKGVPEDPVTGTSHCVLAPLWATRLSKTRLHARQLSPRGGDVLCTLLDSERVLLSGQACTFSSGAMVAPLA